MSGLSYLPFLVFYLFVFSFVIYLAYRLVNPLRYRMAMRTWLVVFYGENFILMFLPAGTYLPGLPTLFKYGGSEYLMGFTELNEFLPALLLGQRPEELRLMLLPLVPALLVFFYTRRYHPALSPKSPSSPPPGQPPTPSE